MNRLPLYDQNTNRSELTAFLSLGLAAIASISFAVSNALESVPGSDCVVAPLAPKPTAVASRPKRAETDCMPTNLTTIQPLYQPRPTGPGKV